MSRAQTEKANHYLEQLYKLDECKQMLTEIIVFLLEETEIVPKKQPTPKLYLVKK